MTDKAIVTARGGVPGEMEEAVAQTALDVELRRPDGLLVRGDAEELANLAGNSTRVKLLRDTNLLRLGSHTIDVEADDVLDGVATRQRVPRAEAGRWPHHLIQLVGPPLREWVAAIEEIGLEVVEPVGGYGLFVLGSPQEAARVAELPFVEWAGPFQPAWRIGADLAELRGDVSVRIGICPPSALEEVLPALEELEAEVVSTEQADPGTAREGTLGRYAVVEATVSAATARNEIARLPQVRFVDHAPPLELEDERSAQVLNEAFQGGNAAGPTVAGYGARLTDYDVDGTGTTIAVIDSGIDDHDNATIHPDLRGRFAFFADQSGGTSTTDINGHGTHVAAIAAGNGATGDTDPGGFVLGQGVAPGAQVGAINAIGTGATTSVASWFSTAVQNGAQVANNSWGGGGGGSGYTTLCATTDGAVRDPDTATAHLERLTIVFSAGNNGGAASSMTDPKEAKNVIVVGNSLNSRPGEQFPVDDVRGMNGRSSRGPALDGRIVPTVVAPGTDIVAARSTIDADATTPGTQPNRPAYRDSGGTAHNQHTQMSGTSMATPHVSGAIALLIERWRIRTGQDPSPAMVRALLVNTAEDLGGGPNWRAVFTPWTTAGANFTAPGFGFAPAQLVERDFGAGTWQTLTQVANPGAITAAGQWAYTAATDTITVRTTTGGRPYATGPNNVGIHILDPNPLANVPNNDQGWGRVSLQNLLMSSPDSDRGPRVVVDERFGFDTDGQEWTLRVAPADPSRPMRITLTWTDVPAAVGANPALVNDLDLEVTEAATGNVFLGNQLNNGFSVAGGTSDTLHNVECVYIQNPDGVYDVSVIAGTLRADARPPFGTASPWQDFAIVIDNAEVQAGDPVDVALAIDRSGSMVTSGYVDVTRTAARGFVDLLAVDDGVGVASFGSTAIDEFPQTTPPTVRSIAAQTDRDQAIDAIDAISFGGSTEMGAGLQTAAGMLAASTGKRAVVLLSDGKDNGSPDARTVAGGLPADLAVHTCAMGPASDQLLLDDVADATGGIYLYMPTIDDLFLLLNVIREQVTGTGLIVNTAHTASKSRVGAWVEAEAEEVTFLVNFDDPKLRAVDSLEKDEGVVVRLRTPSGRLLHPREPVVQRSDGNGYVGLTVADPMPGQWYLEVATGRRRHTRYTVGGFVRSPIQFDMQLSGGLRGRPLGVRVCTTDPRGTPKLRGKVCVTSPNRSVEKVENDFRTLLRGRRFRRTLKGDPIPENLLKYRVIESALSKERRVPIEHEVQCFPLGMARAEVPGPTKVVVGSPGRTVAGIGVTTEPGRATTNWGIGLSSQWTTVPGLSSSAVDLRLLSLMAENPGLRELLGGGSLAERFKDLLSATRGTCMEVMAPTKGVAGSYTATATVHGISAAGNQFVRTTTRSTLLR